MGVEDDLIVMVFFRLPAPEIPAVDEIVHAGESQLESPMNAQSVRKAAQRPSPLGGHRTGSAPKPPVAGFMTVPCSQWAG